MPRSGLTYSAAFEWREAAHWAGFKRYREFARLPGEEQSEIVAHYRVHMQSEAVVTQEQQRKANRLARQKKPKSGPS